MPEKSPLDVIRNLPLLDLPLNVTESDTTAADVTALPSGIIAGGTMLAFSEDLLASGRSAVAHSVLLAQEGAKSDPAAITPELWVDRHDMLLRSLGWLSTSGSSQYTRYEKANLDVHQAIIPLLTATFGPAAAVGTLIITGLTQLQKIDEDRPWIALFDRESRRFEHQEYRFAAAEAQGEGVVVRLAALRFVATAKRMQVLFFKTKDVDVELSFGSRTLVANSAVLESLRVALEKRLAERSKHLIDTIDLPAFG